jgi:peptidoglycan L-alanyl-D-glutamate endopeptidase CwlK
LSTRLFESDVQFFQRLLSSAGFYAGKIDGVWGGKTDAAAALWDTRFAEIRSAFMEMDGRSESCIRTLLPEAQVLARKLLGRLRSSGLDARILSGTRTYSEQSELFRRGRSGNPGPRVTNARAGQSNHNFGIAWDIGLFEGGRYLQESPSYDWAGKLSAAVEEIEWGGSWKSFPDRPHYQVSTGLPISEIRRRFEEGKLHVK